MKAWQQCAVVAAVMIGVQGLPAVAQVSRWASADEPTVKHITEMERTWAESGCSAKPMPKDFIADDFQGTAPNGNRYPKAEAVRTDNPPTERDCALDGIKVRFFGDNLAMVYGSEHATRKDKEEKRCLVWTDTWLKRDGKWQIIAAQDTAVPCK